MVTRVAIRAVWSGAPSCYQVYGLPLVILSHPGEHYVLENLLVDRLVDLHPSLEEVQRHHMSIPADHSQAHHSSRVLGSEDHGYVSRILAHPPVILPVDRAVHGKQLLSSEKKCRWLPANLRGERRDLHLITLVSFCLNERRCLQLETLVSQVLIDGSADSHLAHFPGLGELFHGVGGSGSALMDLLRTARNLGLRFLSLLD